MRRGARAHARVRRRAASRGPTTPAHRAQDAGVALRHDRDHRGGAERLGRAAREGGSVPARCREGAPPPAKSASISEDQRSLCSLRGFVRRVDRRGVEGGEVGERGAEVAQDFQPLAVALFQHLLHRRVVEGDGVVVHYAGNYDNYLSLRPTPRARESAEPAQATRSNSSPPAATAGQAKKRPPKLTFREEQELQHIEQRIEDAEARVAALQSELTDPELYKTDASRVDEVKKALSEAESELTTAMARWEQLETKREAFESFSSR